MKKIDPLDIFDPKTRALVDGLHQKPFVQEGTFVAFPACFPGVTVPIPGDECHITALAVSPDGDVYGGTSGHACHLFVGFFRAVTGAVVDLGVVADADRCTAIGCGPERLFACVNGPEGGRIVSQELQPLPFHLIQEWSIERQPLHELGYVEGKESILHAATAPDREIMVGVTDHHLFAVHFSESKIETIAEIPGPSQVAFHAQGCCVGLDEDSALWSFNPQDKKIARKAIQLPDGNWQAHKLNWARDPNNGYLYVTDADGALYRLDAECRWSRCLGHLPLNPPGPMAVTYDGRVYGSCGDGIGRMFEYDPRAGAVKDLGIAVSVIERRRYGYVYGCAVTGKNGEILFGEDDESGHLWLYFPKILPLS